MSDSDRRRERAARLLAMALKARETGQSQYADELTKLASDVQDEATPIEDSSIPRPQAEPQQPAQQQQQPQPKRNGK
jgi:hypothetical protein